MCKLKYMVLLDEGITIFSRQRISFFMTKYIHRSFIQNIYLTELMLGNIAKEDQNKTLTQSASVLRH